MFRPPRCPRSLAIGLALVVLVAGSGRSSAGVIVAAGNGSFDENLLFTNNPPDGTTIAGVTNNTGYFVDITSVSATALHGNGGQARVERSGGGLFDGALFTPNTVGPPSLTGFTTFIFNVNVDLAGTLNIQVFLNGSGTPAYDSSILPNTDFAVASGENFFNVVSDGGDVITGVRIATPTNNIEDIRQIRFAGLNTPLPTTTTTTGTATTGNATGGAGGPDAPAVPEPVSIALWGAIGGGLALFGRRKKVAA